MTSSDEARRPTARLAMTAGGCAVFVGWAVAAEVVAGSSANSQVPALADDVFPLAWPQPVRVVWWLAVAAGALAFRVALHRLGLRQRPAVVMLSVVPFVVFAAGVAAGAEWATWH